MIRGILLLAVFLILICIFQWRLTQWKINEIKTTSEQIEKKLDNLDSELDNVIEQYTKDRESWKRTKDLLK